MCKTVYLVVCIVLVLVCGGVAGAAGQEIYWTNVGVGDSWCTSGNWNPSQVPGQDDAAFIDGRSSSPYPSPDRGPIIDCSATVNTITGPYPGAGQILTMDVSSDLTVRFDGGGQIPDPENAWVWRRGSGEAIVNITGSPTISIGGSWRCHDLNGTLNISGNPDIYVDGSAPHGQVRGADETGGIFILNMSGGTLNCDLLLWGDNGGGELNLSGGTIITRDDVRLGGARGTDPITVNMTGGEILIGDTFECPSKATRSGAVAVYLRAGVIECDEFTHGDSVGDAEEWLLDIEEGTLKINDDVRATINQNIADGLIKAYDGDSTVVVEFVAGQTVVTAVPPDPNFALNPNPSDGANRVDPNVVLSWTAGINAASQNVYFGTNAENVENGLGGTFKGSIGPDVNEYDPCDLDHTTVYYWRIDTVNGPNTWTGKVWNFRTSGVAIDPNLLLWYKLDEQSGSITASDSSGLELDAAVSIDWTVVHDPWLPEGGYIDGACVFNLKTVLGVPTYALETIDHGITVSVWLKDAYRPLDEDTGDNWVFCTGYGGEEGQYHVAAAVVTDLNDPEGGGLVLWRAGNNAEDVLTWDMTPLHPATLEGWHHWAFAKDQVGGTMSIYFDGTLVESNDVVTQTLDRVQGAVFNIGASTWDNYSYNGAMDDFRIYDYPLSAKEIGTVIKGGDPALAWLPSPYDGQQDVLRETAPSWKSGDYATHHDVYLGTDFDDVNTATTASSGIYASRQPVEDVNYQPAAALELGTTYYWRIDEVNEANEPDDVWKGNVWRFTVANFLVVDDFEAYDSVTNKIFFTWEDGNVNLTGSFIDLGVEPFDSVHGGTQSMLYTYDNTIKWDWDHYWSEGGLPFASPQDFTDAGVKALTLYFYGDPGNNTNDTEELYVGLTGSLAEVRYTDDAGRDMNDLKRSEWTEWNIPISDFIGVDPCAVTSVLIGFGDRDNTDTVGGQGTVYFDDVRLYSPRCVPSIIKPAGDLNNDCVVNFGDVGIMGEHWLRTDANLNPVQAASPGPVGHWAFDEGSGSDANDSSINGNHGTIEGSYKWVTGRIGLYALEFSGGKVVVPDAAELRPADELTAAAWVNSTQSHAYSARIVVKGVDAGNLENFALQINSDDHVGWYVRDANTDMHSVGSDEEILHGEWYHIAGSYDGSAVNCYVNGQLSGFDPIGAITLLQDSNSLAIGDAVDVYRAYFGKVDDVQLYDYALSEAQVAHLATEGSGYLALTSQANLHNGEPAGQKAINIRDVAELLNSWLEERLWPE